MRGYFCIGFITLMLKGKSLTDFTNLFSPNSFFLRNDDIILNYFMTIFLKKVECNSVKTHDIYPNLNDKQQFRLNKINEVLILLQSRLFCCID